MTVVLRRRPLCVVADLTWGAISAGMILTVGRRLLFVSPLGRSVAGIWSIWTILALAVAWVTATMQRKLRPARLSLSDQGLNITGREGQRALPWSELAVVAATNRTTTRGVWRTVELRFGGEPSIYLDDKFTVGRDELVRMILRYASAAGAIPAVTADRSAAEELHDRRIGLIAVGAYVLPILIVAMAVIGLAWHARHLR